MLINATFEVHIFFNDYGFFLHAKVFLFFCRIQSFFFSKIRTPPPPPRNQMGRP